MYKAVVFDYGNVLCTIDRDSFVRKAALHSTLSPEAIRIALWDGKLELDYESGKFDSRKYFALAREAAHLDEDYGFDQFVEDYRQIIQPNPDGERGLSVARDLGARTFVLSNTSFLHARELFSNELLASIPELHILSYKVGVMKPHPRIWLKLLEYAHLEPEECLYIDDVSEYCAAAQRLGFGIFCYDMQIHRLAGIVEDVLK